MLMTKKIAAVCLIIIVLFGAFILYSTRAAMGAEYAVEGAPFAVGDQTVSQVVTVKYKKEAKVAKDGKVSKDEKGDSSRESPISCWLQEVVLSIVVGNCPRSVPRRCSVPWRQK